MFEWIDDIGQIWKLWSVRIAAVGAVITGAWLALPSDIKAMFPDAWEPYIGTAFLLLTIAARSIKQKRKPDGRL